MQLDYKCYTPYSVNQNIVHNPLSNIVEAVLLKTGQCHVDHEGFDLNEIERAYYEVNGLSLYHDDTWYKDGGQESGTNSILQPWFVQTNKSSLIIDHSHFVFRYPITGEARNQILEYSKERPELLRLLSVNFKCGLDLCIDYINEEDSIIEPVVHIEWDFDNMFDLIKTSLEVKQVIDNKEWIESIPSILRYNKLAKRKKVDAFDQADTRSMILFGAKAYKLISTL